MGCPGRHHGRERHRRRVTNGSRPGHEPGSLILADRMTVIHATTLVNLKAGRSNEYLLDVARQVAERFQAGATGSTGCTPRPVHRRPADRNRCRLVRRDSRGAAADIVAGAYGHSRIREWARGSVTRALLKHSVRSSRFSTDRNARNGANGTCRSGRPRLLNRQARGASGRLHQLPDSRNTAGSEHHSPPFPGLEDVGPGHRPVIVAVSLVGASHRRGAAIARRRIRPVGDGTHGGRLRLRQLACRGIGQRKGGSVEERALIAEQRGYLRPGTSLGHERHVTRHACGSGS